MPTITAHVHRFHDYVALHVGNGETVYISADDASELAEALETCADSVRTEGFINSSYKSHALEFETKE